MSIVLTESRLIVFLYNLVSLSLTIMILKEIEISTSIQVLLLTAMLPYYVGITLIPILFIGKRLHLTDEDFRIVFVSWLSTPYEYGKEMAARLLDGRRRSQRVQPIIPEAADATSSNSVRNPAAGLAGEQDEAADSLDDISISSECIAAIIGESSGSDKEAELGGDCL